ncbi:ABC transporter permease [Streptomyces sp. AK02-01A]|uniref:ABC transporter permease n=1 Tax=Streptomyces sp. AK02-01A TaxID=3028648 RepID=UPI0029A05057|nr:ABC transporter permease [Streptomyces sp. AK02-01A]MDX3854937.1 ABC transporter permease [Streptomyces sp. AK02-01A]
MTAIQQVSALPRSRTRRIRPGTALASAILVLLVVAAFAPGLLAGYDPEAVDPANALAPMSGDHLFGTDQLGRDVFSRVVYGAGPSLSIGVGATMFAVVAGALLGVVAATGGRVVDECVMRVTDVLIAFPGLLLALLMVAVLGPSSFNAALAIVCSVLPGYVRLARGQALVVRRSDFVRAAVTLGRPGWDIGLRHLLPNALPPLMVLSLVNVGTAIVAGSSLSFLGMGPKPPAPEWGVMLSEGRDFLDSAWYAAFFPGAALAVSVMALNVVGRRLQHRFEGRLTDV